MKKLILASIFIFFKIGISIASSDNFVSLKGDKVNLRNGPGSEYSIKYIYQARHLPLKVSGEYEGWLKVLDKEGDEGWVSKNLTSKNR